MLNKLQQILRRIIIINKQIVFNGAMLFFCSKVCNFQCLLNLIDPTTLPTCNCLFTCKAITLMYLQQFGNYYGEPETVGEGEVRRRGG